MFFQAIRDLVCSRRDLSRRVAAGADQPVTLKPDAPSAQAGANMPDALQG